MAITELPKYDEGIEKYVLVDNVDEFVDKVLKNPPPVMAIDTETYYNPEMKDAVIKFIKGSKNNCPFGVSFYWEQDGVEHGYWVNKDLEKLAPIVQHPDIIKVFHNFK